MEKMTSTLLLLAILLALGCSRRNEVPEDAWGRLDADAVLLKVGESSYTKRMLEEDCRLHDFLTACYLETANVPKEKRAEIRDQADTRFRMDVMSIKLKLMVLKNYYGGKPNPLDVGQAESNCVRGTSNGAMGFEAIRARAAKERLEATLMAEMALESYDARIRREVRETTNVISAARVEKFFAEQYACNRQAAEGNPKIYASASNAVLRLRAGEKMADLEKEFFPTNAMGHIEPFPNAMEVDFGEDEKALWKRLEKLPVGGVSEVEPREDGLYVFRHDADEGTGDACTLNYSALVFRRMMVFDILTRDQIRSRLAEQASDEAQEKIWHAVWKAAKIEFPSGKDVFAADFLDFLERVDREIKSDGASAHTHK